MSAVHDDTLPEDYVQQLITIFTTTSVDAFNELFKKIKSDLLSMELQATLNMNMISTGMHLKNNMDSATYVLELARTVYNDFVQKGLWDKCINATPGQSGLLAAAATVAEGYTCFNCGAKGKHRKENCPHPVNEERQKVEKDKFNLERSARRGPQQSTKFNNRGRPIPKKWREPEASENNKRVIDNVPHTYNPTSKGWIKDVTPDSGAVANITTKQLERLEALETENELLKTDISTLGSPASTPGKSINYTRQQAVLNNTTTPSTPSEQQRVYQERVNIREQMLLLQEKFASL